MEMKATAKSVGISTRKVRLVADTVRNRSVRDAMQILLLLDKRGALAITKTLKSAMANAVNAGKMKEENLFIDRLDVQEGPFLKRYHASTRGRIHPYKRRTSHITIVLKEKGEIIK